MLGQSYSLGTQGAPQDRSQQPLACRVPLLLISSYPTSPPSTGLFTVSLKTTARCRAFPLPSWFSALHAYVFQIFFSSYSHKSWKSIPLSHIEQIFPTQSLEDPRFPVVTQWHYIAMSEDFILLPFKKGLLKHTREKANLKKKKILLSWRAMAANTCHILYFPKHMDIDLLHQNWLHQYYILQWLGAKGKLKNPSDNGSVSLSCLFGLLHIKTRKAHFRSLCYLTAIKATIILLTQPMLGSTCHSRNAEAAPEEHDMGFTHTPSERVTSLRPTDHPSSKYFSIADCMYTYVSIYILYFCACATFHPWGDCIYEYLYFSITYTHYFHHYIILTCLFKYVFATPLIPKDEFPERFTFNIKINVMSALLLQNAKRWCVRSALIFLIEMEKSSPVELWASLEKTFRLQGLSTAQDQDWAQSCMLKAVRQNCLLLLPSTGTDSKQGEFTQ